MGRPIHTFHPTKTTSVAVFYDLYHEFNTDSTHIALQALLNRSMYLYVNDKKYRKMIEAMVELQKSGSGF